MLAPQHYYNSYFYLTFISPDEDVIKKVVHFSFKLNKIRKFFQLIRLYVIV